jgi:hypothetical protein
MFAGETNFPGKFSRGLSFDLIQDEGIAPVLRIEFRKSFGGVEKVYSPFHTGIADKANNAFHAQELFICTFFQYHKVEPDWIFGIVDFVFENAFSSAEFKNIPAYLVPSQFKGGSLVFTQDKAALVATAGTRPFPDVAFSFALAGRQEQQKGRQYQDGEKQCFFHGRGLEKLPAKVGK